MWLGSIRAVIAVSVGPRAYIVFPVALRGIRRMLTGPGGRFAHGIFRLTVFPARPDGCGAIFAMRYETELKTQAMKSIVRMTVAAAVLLFSAGSLAAQGPDGQKMTPEQRAERMTQRMTEQLSLSDEQARQIEQILLDHFKEMPQAPRRPAGESSARPSDRRSDPGAEQRQKMDEQIKSVLTDAQYQKWTEMRRDMKTRRDYRRGHKPGQGKHGRPICDSVCPCAETVSD